MTPAPSRMPGRASDGHAAIISAPIQGLHREQVLMKFEISADDLPSPERRAALQDMIDSLREVRSPGAERLGTRFPGFHRRTTRNARRPHARPTRQTAGTARRTPGMTSPVRPRISIDEIRNVADLYALCMLNSLSGVFANDFSDCASVRDRGVGGSNPLAPTNS